MIYENDIQQCVKTFQHNGVILYPTDTIWGLGCLADDEKAIEKISSIKNRPAEKNLIVLMTDIKQLFQYIANPLPNLQELIAKFQTPTTIIYDNAINLPNAVIASNGSVAIRITSDPFCRSLIKRTKKPIVSTSANFSGETSPSTFKDVNESLKSKVDYVVQYRQNDTETANPSAILKLLPNGEFLKIR